MRFHWKTKTNHKNKIIASKIDKMDEGKFLIHEVEEPI